MNRAFAIPLGVLLAVAARPAVACEPALPVTVNDLTILPTANSVAPINTKLWVVRTRATDGGFEEVALVTNAGTEQVSLTETKLGTTQGGQTPVSSFSPSTMLKPETSYEIRINGATKQTFTTSSEFDNTPPERPVLTAHSLAAAQPAVAFSSCGGAPAMGTFEYAPVSPLAFFVRGADLRPTIPSRYLMLSGSKFLGMSSLEAPAGNFGVIAVDLAGNVTAGDLVNVTAPVAGGCTSTPTGFLLSGLALVLLTLRRASRK